MKVLNISENGIYMVIEITDKNEVKLLHFSAIEFGNCQISDYEKSGFRIVELALSGFDRPEERHGIKYTVTAPGYRLKYHKHFDYRNEWGRKLEIITHDEETQIFVTSHYQFYNGISIVHCFSEVENRGEKEQGIEYISSFNLNGIEKEGLAAAEEKINIMYPHNSWQRELQWQSRTLKDAGLTGTQPEGLRRSSKAFHISNTGNWSTKEYLPMGYIENKETGTGLFWQIEHNGSWNWEISDQTGHLYLQLSGPTENESHWYKRLGPKEKFVSVPAAVGVGINGFEQSIGELTRYRRKIRRVNIDNERLGIIFNDYMNCLWGKPTTEKELPLIDAAAEVGCEYYCIDAGWYADGYWWDNVGEWIPSKERFPKGIKEVIDYIKNKGMIPGLWLEIEVMGIHCELASKVEDDWFFQRHGKKVYDRSRYQLDFRNPKVVLYASKVIERLVDQYGIGYIKMDYNIEPGIGTEINSDSFGDGLLGHERAYMMWLDSIFEKYPDLIIENCSSGGLRMDYALLSRHSIQSTSDQEDYRLYATIAANAPVGVTPEQAAIWSYPLAEGDDREEVIFNMVNALLLRIHQSGHLGNLKPESRGLVKEALDYYKLIREDIKTSLPFWPLGLSSYSDSWVSLGLYKDSKSYLALWRRASLEDVCQLPMSFYKEKKLEIKCAYPSGEECEFNWNIHKGLLSIRLPKEYSARLFELDCIGGVDI